MKTFLKARPPLAHVSHPMEGGLVKTILEIGAELAQLLVSYSMEGGLVKTILEIVGLPWRM